MAEHLAGMQEEINEKLKHGFDTRHIYQMLQTFVETITEQSEQIKEMQDQADRSENIIETLSATIRKMELNIQGFHSYPSIHDDAQTLKASRRNSRRYSQGVVTNEVQIGTSSSSTSPRTQLQPSDAKSQAKNKQRSDASWKYKKRRIIRQVSSKIMEENERSKRDLLAASSETKGVDKAEEEATQQQSSQPAIDSSEGDSTKQEQEVEKVEESVLEKTSVPVIEQNESVEESNEEYSPRVDDKKKTSDSVIIPTSEKDKSLDPKPDQIVEKDEMGVEDQDDKREPVMESEDEEEEVDIDPKQTVNYRITELEKSLARLSAELEMQQQKSSTHHSVRAAPQTSEASVQTDNPSVSVQVDETASVQLGSPVREIDVNSFTEDIPKPEEHHSAPPEKSEDSELDDYILRVNDKNELPEKHVSTISRQVCNSEPMKKLLERIFKGTEKLVDQGLKRIPKPPPPVTANDLLSESIVATLAQSMLKRGLLDELRPPEPEDPASTSEVPIQPVIQRPTPPERPSSSSSSASASVDLAKLQELTKHLISREEAADLVAEQVKLLEASLQPPVETQPKEMPHMDDEISDEPEPAREPIMSERAKSVLERQVEALAQDKVSREQLEEVKRNVLSSLTIELQKLSDRLGQSLEQTASGLQSRVESSEKSAVHVGRKLHDLEAHMTIQLQQLQSLTRPTKKKDEEGWKSDLMKVSQSLNKAREDQRNVAKMLVEELESLQREVKNRVDERQLEQLAATIEDKLQKEMGQSVSGINLSMAKIINAVRNKTDRSETEAIIQSRLNEAQESLHDLQEDDPAGAFKCISCGASGKKMNSSASLDTLSFASAILSQSNEVRRNRGGDLDQTAAVLSRQAGLRPVSRQQKPMTPHHYTPTSAPSKEMSMEPLYRRAKFANQLREIPKIPNISFSAGNSNQYKLDENNGGGRGAYFPNITPPSAPANPSGGL